MSKKYYYHIIPGDTSSTKVPLTQEELYGFEKTLSQSVCVNYRANIHTQRAQRDAAKLISISYHCLGGNDPCHLSHKSKTKKRSILLPPQYRFDYLSYFIEELIKMMTKFDRNKGCWTQYVLWARGKGLRRIIQQMKRDEKHEKLIRDITSALNLMGTFCKLDSDSTFFEENDSFEDRNNEKFKQNTTSVDGGMGSKQS